MAQKPKRIRVLYSPITRRFYATRSWRYVGAGNIVVTGEKFDVTQDIAAIVVEHEIEFSPILPSTPAPEHGDRRPSAPPAPSEATDG